MRIAVVGAGVSGLVAARSLIDEHDVTVFEAGAQPGGHAHTVALDLDGRTWDVDCGFVVLNDRNYPAFTRLLEELGVERQPTHMGFSVTAEHENFEYAGTPAGLFCQRRNLARPRFLKMIVELLRFNRELGAQLNERDRDRSLGDFVEQGGYSSFFLEHLIGPQACALWSADPETIWDLPVRFVARFFDEHGLLRLRGRPAWSTITGGSARYVETLTHGWDESLRCSTPVAGITRFDDHVEVLPVHGSSERFDRVVLACHSDQALALLTDPSAAERRILGAIRYQENEVVLHTDERLLPRAHAARQAWNYRRVAEPVGAATVTYSMNRLQRLDAPVEVCVSLNLTDRIDPRRIVDVMHFTHPVFDHAAIAAQARRDDIDGLNLTHFCGAYWGYGFHEDGVVSALRTTAKLRAEVLA
jgi:predicted NAD/FAD-binding protein